MKVIFLDIDGVLNCDRTPNPRKFPYVVDKGLLKLFNGLLLRSGAKVVLSSTWRCDPIGLLAAKYWRVPFIDITPDEPKKPRSAEILSWLERHRNVSRFVILDDEDDGLDDLPLFQPSSKTGLTRKISKGIENYLSGRSDQDMRASSVVRVQQNIRSLFKRDKS
jgi:hypothetical protein